MVRKGIVIFGILASCAPSTRGQMPMMMHEHAVGPSAALTTVMDRGDLVFDLGPIDLPAKAMHDDIRQPAPLTVVIGIDGWLRGYSIELVDSAGRDVPQSVVHHVNVIIPQRRELFSPIMLRLAAAGSETAPVGLPWFLGYEVRKTDSVLVSAMLHNPSAVAYRGVHLRVRMPATRRRLLGAMAVFPFYMDVMPPAGSHSFDLPAGRTERYWEGSPAIGGRILGVSGHMHKYGVALRLEDRTTGKVIWEGRPTVDEHGEVVAIPIKRFVKTFGVGVHPDHVYRLTVVYDNPTGAPVIDGGMGALGGVFLPSEAEKWPAVDRTNADYVLDWRITYRLDTSRDVRGGHSDKR
jgi:hypothetical protein